MDEKKKLMDKTFLNHLNNHNKPKTRRDFLSLGLLGFAGFSCYSTAFASRVLNKVSSTNNSMPFLNDSSDPAFLVIDLSGGAALVGNYLVGNKGGSNDLLSSYSSLGWDPKNNKIDRRFGLPMADVNISKILQGITETASNEAQANFRFASICHQASSDSSRNPLNAMSLVVAAGGRGKYIASSLGSLNSTSGGRSKFALKGDKYKPIHVKSSSALANLLGLGDVINGLPKNAQKEIIQNFGMLSSLMNKSITGDNKIKFDKILQGATSEFEDRLLNTLVQLDSRLDSDAAQIYNINEATSPTSKEVVFSSIVMNAVKGSTGPGVITIGGCDYHDGTFTRGDAKDLEIGQNIGRAVELAKRNKKSLFIQIITDGGIYSADGVRNWRGDSDDRCMSILGYYNPNKIPQYHKNNSFQLGNYTNGQGADRSTLVGNSPILATYASFANYLNVSGRISEFNKYAPGIFDSKQLDEVLLFGA